MEISEIGRNHHILAFLTCKRQRAASLKRLIADPALPVSFMTFSWKVQMFQFCFIRKWFFRKSVSCQGLWHFLLHIWAISLSQGWRSSYMCMRARTHMDTHTTERMWFSAATRGYGGRKIPFMRSQEKKKKSEGGKKKKRPTSNQPVLKYNWSLDQMACKLLKKYVPSSIQETCPRLIKTWC